MSRAAPLTKTLGIYVKRMLELFGYVGWLLSPSRAISDLWKQGDRPHRGSALRRWSFFLFNARSLLWGQ